MADAYKMELEKVKSFMGEERAGQIKEDFSCYRKQLTCWLKKQSLHKTCIRDQSLI